MNAQWNPIPSLLGGGADLTGRLVEYWGKQWIISGKNYCGDWDVVRFEKRESGNIMRIESSIAPEILAESHPHFAQLLTSDTAVAMRKLTESHTFLRQLLAGAIHQAGGEILLIDGTGFQNSNPTILTHSDAYGLHIKVKVAL